MNGESNRKVIENYLLLLVSVYYNYLLLEDFDPLLLITGYYFENQSITYYFSITYYLLPHVWFLYRAQTIGNFTLSINSLGYIFGSGISV